MRSKIHRFGEAWSRAEVNQLGQVPDSLLARRQGRRIQEVVAGRERRRIALCTPPRRWTLRELRLLGTLTDAELGRRLRRSRNSVYLQRRLRRIPAFQRQTQRTAARPWQPREIRLLGRYPDSAVARRLGRPLKVVAYQRRSRGIAAFRPMPAIRTADTALLRWAGAALRRVGTASDAHIAAQLGCSVTFVARKRRELGRKPFVRAWTKADQALLGLGPDTEVAPRLGRTLAAVKRMRDKLGIPAWRPEA